MGRKTCRLPGCGRLITAKGRTKYCCAECAAEANRLRQRRPERQAETKARRALRFAAKSPIKRRVCLACDRMFMSEGPWNRICHDCKRRQRQHRGLWGMTPCKFSKGKDDSPLLRELEERNVLCGNW